MLQDLLYPGRDLVGLRSIPVSGPLGINILKVCVEFVVFVISVFVINPLLFKMLLEDIGSVL